MAEVDLKVRLLDAALPHVAFDGWSEGTLQAAARDSGLPKAVARAIFPRRGVDLALAYHARGDEEMVERLKATDLSALRFRDRIARAVLIRLECSDRELVRRGTTLFALPGHSAEGAAAVWRTADRIWRALGDESQDVNWYSKRATLTAVYGATVLYWLGDTSPDARATAAFLDRLVDEVMGFEKLKARFRASALGRAVAAGPGRVLAAIRVPAAGSGEKGPKS